MIHDKFRDANIGDSVAWRIGFRYFIARVHDKHPRGLILKLGGKFINHDYEFFESLVCSGSDEACVIDAGTVTRLLP